MEEFIKLKVQLVILLRSQGFIFTSVLIIITVTTKLKTNSDLIELYFAIIDLAE